MVFCVGHRVIIERLKFLANEVAGSSVLITFHPHPRKVLYPETAGKELKLINSHEEKISLMEDTGLDHGCVKGVIHIGSDESIFLPLEKDFNLESFPRRRL